MCNLYNVTTTHEAIIAWVRAMRDMAGNMPPAFGSTPTALDRWSAMHLTASAS